MNNTIGKGELWLRKRNIQRIAFVALCGSIGGFIGVHYGIEKGANPSLSIIDYIVSVPLSLTFFFSFLMIGLLIYNWIRLDEFERPRYDKSSSFGLFSGFLIIPWYFGSLQGIFPTPNPLACLFLIFGVKWVVHAIFKYKS